jgi:hypothetical protein
MAYCLKCSEHRGPRTPAAALPGRRRPARWRYSRGLETASDQQLCSRHGQLARNIELVIRTSMGRPRRLRWFTPLLATSSRRSMLVKRLSVRGQHYMWPTDYNCSVFPEAYCFITVLCCRSSLPGGKWSCRGGRRCEIPDECCDSPGCAPFGPGHRQPRSGQALSAKGAAPRSSRS